ncbi:MAG TPA: flavin reductase family protein [Candidatus Acidoferrales bacterium]|nr:flavin reductase family protein [Candidatus Acidoferrales bacterium]
MDPNARKKALRMVSYGLYVATSPEPDGMAAGTINWITQSSFDPPLIVAGIKRDSALFRAIETSRVFAINVVGKSQKAMAISFFKGGAVEGDRLNGYKMRPGQTNSAILEDAPAAFECRALETVQRGDHAIFVAEVVAAHVHSDEEPLTLREAGFNYAG